MVFCICCVHGSLSYLSQSERPGAVFQLVLHGAQLFKLPRAVGEGLQPADGAAQLLLVLHHQEPQEGEHLKGQRGITSEPRQGEPDVTNTA